MPGQVVGTWYLKFHHEIAISLQDGCRGLVLGVSRVPIVSRGSVDTVGRQLVRVDAALRTLFCSPSIPFSLILQQTPFAGSWGRPCDQA